MKILLVEDSERLRRSISAGLATLGWSVDQAEDGRLGLDLARSVDYDVIILDLMLPGLDGLSLLRRLRAGGDVTHVLILSARDRVEDRVLGLNEGADDYLVKPFALDELVARLQAMDRRAMNTKSALLECPPVRLDTHSRRVFCAEQEVPLTRSEYVLLEYLVRRRGRVLSHGQLIDRLHDFHSGVTKNAVEVHISQLRKKLDEAGAGGLIVTKRGHGYVVG